MTRIALPGALAAATAIGITVLSPHALAQQPALCLPTYIAIAGTGDGVLPGSSGEAPMEVWACAPGDVIISQGPIPTLVLGSNDPVDSKTGFRKAFIVRPCGLADGSDLPGAKLTVSFQSDRPEANHKAMLTLAPDTGKPTLNTTSTPRKGTRVKAGDTIKVRMEASEEYSADRKGWQTGVRKLQLIDEGPNPVVTPHWEDAQMRACASKQWKQFLEVTYTVPSNPPPVIRLRAVADDFAGNQDEDIAEFPTGDWYGTFGWTHSCQAPTLTDETEGFSDLTLNDDGRGNLTGTLVGSTPRRRQAMATCSYSRIAPGRFNARLVGSYTRAQNTMSAQAVNVQTAPGKASWTCPGGTTTVDEPFYTVYEAPVFQNAFRDLRPQPDGSLKATGKDVNSAGGATCTTAYTLTLRRGQN